MAVDALVRCRFSIRLISRQLRLFNLHIFQVQWSPLLNWKRVKSHFIEGRKLWKVKNRAQLLWFTSEEIFAHTFTAYDCINCNEHIWVQRMTWYIYIYLVFSNRRMYFDVIIRWNMRLMTSANYVNRPEIAKSSPIPLIGHIVNLSVWFFL